MRLVINVMFAPGSKKEPSKLENVKRAKFEQNSNQTTLSVHQKQCSLFADTTLKGCRKNIESVKSHKKPIF